VDQAIKAKWVEALRSGKYQQGTGQLRGYNSDCCLGVLAVVAGLPDEQIGRACQLSELRRDDLVGPWSLNELEPEYGLNEPASHTTTQRKLAAMNDGGASFAEIADYIEANL
jgi:hypothetical protein